MAQIWCRICNYNHLVLEYKHLLNIMAFCLDNILDFGTWSLASIIACEAFGCSSCPRTAFRQLDGLFRWLGRCGRSSWVKCIEFDEINVHVHEKCRNRLKHSTTQITLLTTLRIMFLFAGKQTAQQSLLMLHATLYNGPIRLNFPMRPTAPVSHVVHAAPQIPSTRLGATSVKHKKFVVAKIRIIPASIAMWSQCEHTKFRA